MLKNGQNSGVTGVFYRTIGLCPQVVLNLSLQHSVLTPLLTAPPPGSIGFCSQVASNLFPHHFLFWRPTAPPPGLYSLTAGWIWRFEVVALLITSVFHNILPRGRPISPQKISADTDISEKISADTDIWGLQAIFSILKFSPSIWFERAFWLFK